MLSRSSILLLAACSASVVNGFSFPERPATRRVFFENFGRSVTVASVLLAPTLAIADVTSQLAAPAALRAIKRARKKISNLEDTVLLNDYTGIKAALRLESISDLRKSCSTIIKATEDGPNAESILTNYRTMITSLEKLDSVASVGMRGRKLSNSELKESYDLFVTSLDRFIEISESSTVDYSEQASS
jgi:hypothetical protein